MVSRGVTGLYIKGVLTKTVMRIELLIVLLLFNLLKVYSQENILESYNGDFEDGLDYWRFFDLPGNSGSDAAITMDAVNGDYAIKINYATDFGNVVDRGFDNWLAGVPVTEGQIYTLKAFVKGDTNASERLVKVTFTLGFFDASGQVISQRDRDHPLTDIYAEKSLSAKAPVNAVSCWVAFRLFDATDPCAPLRSMYLDHVRILRPYAVAIDSPTTSESEAINLTNYPNPFTGKTTIKYNLDKSGFVTLRVYDIPGQTVALLVDQQQQHAGSYEVNWVPKNLSSGIYIYRLEVVSASDIKSVINRKMVLEK